MNSAPSCRKVPAGLAHQAARASGAWTGTANEWNPVRILSWRRKRGLRTGAALVAFAAGVLTLSAGDILRGGAAASSYKGRHDAATEATAAAAAQARASAKDALARTTKAVQSVEAMQAAARAAAALQAARNLGANPNISGLTLPDVPDGLAVGGLEVDAGGTWSGANAPTQAIANGRALVGIKQTQQQALLSWKTFNVGTNTTVRFDQSAGGVDVSKWIAFNRVTDPSGAPSQILGSIEAPGQVYLINQNGILFGGTSQVNVHTLVASSLPLNDYFLDQGLLNQPKQTQFQFSALAQSGDVPFTPPALPSFGRIGDVTVMPGARLSSPTSESNVGGRIALIGANVTNAGTIETPDGQTILAAGLQVGLEAHGSSDATLRGLDVYVGAVVDPASSTAAYAGLARNLGLISVPRGSAVVTGQEVLQAGAIDSSTSVSLNGRIDLRAEYDAVANSNYDSVGRPNVPPFLYGGGPSGTGTGLVTVGPGSVTRILPEWGSVDKVIGTSLALRSQINLQGQTLHLDDGALLHAPNGIVTGKAGRYDYVSSTANPNTGFIRSGGEIYVGRDTLINVAGTPDAFSPLSHNILTVTLRSNELADSPLQRSGLLRGPEITVDLRKTGTYNDRFWVGTPLADLTGYLNVIERTIDELTVAGGSINLLSGGPVVVQPGATLDVSAGWYNYGGGTVRTTRVFYRGQIFDIAEATPDRVYDGILTGKFYESHPKWGLEKTFVIPWMTGEHWEDGYLSGAAAGALSLAGSSMALDGTLLGRSVSGPRQQRATPAKGGTLDLDFEIEKVVAGTGLGTPISPTPPSVVFDHNPSPHPADEFALDGSGHPLPLRADRVARVELSPSLLGDQGFDSLKVRNPDGSITVPSGVTLEARPQGSITLEGANVSIFGDLIAPGGTLAFKAYNISPSVATELLASGSGSLPEPNKNRGLFTLGGGARLDTAGLILDYRLTGRTPFTLPPVITGGSVSIQTYSASLAAGSTIDVSGGVQVSPRGAITYGAAGSIEILTGQDLNLAGVDGGSLRLGSTLKGFSGTQGGTLSLRAQMIQVGGALLGPLSLRLDPEFFSEGGFATFNLTGLGGKAEGSGDDEFLPAVWIAPGVHIEPKVLGWLALPYVWPNGEVELVPIERPEGLRSTAKLTLNGKGVTDPFTGALLLRGDVLVDRGAVIRTDALGSVALSGDTVSVYGSIFAPAGSISVAGKNSFPVTGTAPDYAQTTVYLAPGSRLDASGKVLYQRDRWGRRVGSVLPGGTISVSGNIVAERGAVIDVSGVSGELDLHPLQLGLDAFGNLLQPGDRLVPFQSGLTMPLFASLSLPTTLDSGGGSIQLKGGQMLFSDATLLGRAGGPHAQGGTLAVSSGRFAATNSALTNLVVTQSGTTLPVSFAASGISAIGRPVRDGMGTILPGMGYFAVDTFTRGGFASLGLGGNVEFQGPIVINAANALAVATGGVLRADSTVVLNAEYVSLGQPFPNPLASGQAAILFTQQSGSSTVAYNFAPTYGPGTLDVHARLIDVGTLSLQGIGRASLRAPGGDIRGNGTFNIAGRLDLEAAQIYPTTAAGFNVIAYDSAGGPGTIWITSSGVADIPLSAAGQMRIYASTIHQGGVLRAPFGVIELGWDGTGSAPFTDPVAGSTLPLPTTANLTLAAGSVTSVAAIDAGGREFLIPYGVVTSAGAWIDPSGIDITSLGPPEKRIQLGAQTLVTQSGSQIDIRGAGDLYAYQWVAGNGGSKDILLNQGSFAIIPGYESPFSPFAPFSSTAETLDGDPGYVNTTLKIGDKIYLGPNFAVPTGTYTLLPARYALMPGAYLVTPQSGSPVGSFQLPGGAVLASGYRFNTYDPGTGASVQSRFEIASSTVVRNRAAYEDHYANTFFVEAAQALKIDSPRLPQDSGRLVLQATLGLDLSGSVAAKAMGAGRGGLVDINSAVGLFVADKGTTGPSGSLLIDTSQLNAMGAESLLLGGLRTYSGATAATSVRTPTLTVSSTGTPLLGTDLILAASDSLTVAPGSIIRASGSMPGGADALLFGTSGTSGSGNGVMVRVSADPAAASSRQSVTAGGTPMLTVGAGSLLSGASVTLDSTAGTSLDAAATLDSPVVTLNSGQISIQLEDPGVLLPGTGLVLAGQSLASLQAHTADLNLLSYTSADFYGHGTFHLGRSLRVSAGQIRGFNQGGGTIRLEAPGIELDNRGSSTVPGIVAAATGNLVLAGETITLGKGALRIDQFTNTALEATGGIVLSSTGSLAVQNDLSLNAPLLAGQAGSSQSITAGGALVLQSGAGSATVTPGLGATLALQGSSVDLGSAIRLPGGELSVRALSGDLRVRGELSAAGVARSFYDQVRYVDAGTIRLTADTGSVRLDAGSVVDVSAEAGGGDGGLLSVSAKGGTLVLDGTLRGGGGSGGAAGSAEIDVLSLPALSPINATLDAGKFLTSRTFRVRSGDVLVDGSARTQSFRLYADQGSITITGTVDTSGRTGGLIDMAANGSLVLTSTGILSAAAREFDNAGKGGSIRLAAGSQINGIVPSGVLLDLQSGGQIDLSVASLVAGDVSTPGSSAFYGRFAGTLHLRAPRNATNTNLFIDTVDSTITGASSILAEGYKLYDLTASGTTGTITSTIQGNVNTQATSFMANHATMLSQLLGADPQGLGNRLVIAPGAEIINRNGDLTLGTSSSTATSDWSLHTYRYGPKSAPGVLTLRTSRDLVFYNALSDGFTPASGSTGTALWLGTPMVINSALPVNLQSWSFQLSAGADLGAASPLAVQPVSALPSGYGSLLLGKFYSATLSGVSGLNATTATAVNNRYQVIRTGTGDIEIAAGRDVQLRNQFASIYTAGVRLPTPTTIFSANDFTVPSVTASIQPGTPELGAAQQTYAPSWTLAGGNVSVAAGQNIGRYTLYNGVLTVDSSRQLPNNWLYRRGSVDSTTGLFGFSGVTDAGIANVSDPSSSTTWWVDFSNFFQGIGTLGGGNIDLLAGSDVVNADAVAPTNARMPGRDAGGTAIGPNADLLVELGGGDINVKAGRNIDGGIYYVERGSANLKAGGTVTTNQARSPSLGILGSSNLALDQSDIIQSRTPEIYDPLTWMPTTFFLGRGGISVSARGDVLVGPVANTFLLPQGLNNKFWYKTFFETYGEESSFDVESIGGSITHRMAVTLPGETSATPVLTAWLNKQNLAITNNLSRRGANYQPWIRMLETNTSPFSSVVGLLPPVVRSTSFGGDINLAGNLTLAPSSTGTIELLASGALNGINKTGPTRTTSLTGKLMTWSSSKVIVSDANPASFPGITSPFSAASKTGTTQLSQRTTSFGGLPVASLLAETGSYSGAAGSVNLKRALHSPGLLHAADSSPVLLYAGGGDLSGLTLFTPKATRAVADRDITDVALYIQNTRADDISLVSAGRDLIAFNESSALRSLAGDISQGNLIVDAAKSTVTGGSTKAATGDIQISGPGVLEVMAGGKIDLGSGPNFTDGTGIGITSIGNSRNPYLPFAGADLVVLGGVGGFGGSGPALGLRASSLDWDSFTSTYSDPASLDGFESAYMAKLGVSDISALTLEQQALVYLEMFYQVLKQSGRDAATTGTYDTGTAAIEALFGSAASSDGQISVRSRDIRTVSGGAISIAAPSGGVSMASQIYGNPLAPPGIVTEYGGHLSIFADQSVEIGQARIFTLRGGNILIWSSNGDIAAGTSAKTVVTAPPTRVLIDTTSADVATDLAGLATGGGIGVLASVKGVEPGDVDLIAPSGVVDAGDAGIRVTGNLNIAATAVLNATNIQAGGSSVGVPSAPTVAAPNIGGLTSAAATAGAASTAATQATNPNKKDEDKDKKKEEEPSIIVVEVLGYGGGEAEGGQ